MECPICRADIDLETVMILANVAGMEVNFYCAGCNGYAMKVLAPEDFAVV